MAVLNKILKPSLAKELETFHGDLLYVLSDEKEIYDSLIENVTLDYAEVERAEFNGCYFKNVVFKECSLEKADFMNTNLKGMDFTDSDISGILLSGKELRGAYVSTMQAVELSLLLGIIIK